MESEIFMTFNIGFWKISENEKFWVDFFTKNKIFINSTFVKLAQIWKSRPHHLGINYYVNFLGHLGIKKSKSWEPFWSYQLKALPFEAIWSNFMLKWAGFPVLFSSKMAYQILISSITTSALKYGRLLFLSIIHQSISKYIKESFTFRLKSVGFCIPERETPQPVLLYLWYRFYCNSWDRDKKSCNLKEANHFKFLIWG